MRIPAFAEELRRPVSTAAVCQLLQKHMNGTHDHLSFLQAHLPAPETELVATAAGTAHEPERLWIFLDRYQTHLKRGGARNEVYFGELCQWLGWTELLCTHAEAAVRYIASWMSNVDPCKDGCYWMLETRFPFIRLAATYVSHLVKTDQSIEKLVGQGIVNTIAHRCNTIYRRSAMY
jgi:hypothetical protein